MGLYKAGLKDRPTWYNCLLYEHCDVLSKLKCLIYIIPLPDICYMLRLIHMYKGTTT